MAVGSALAEKSLKFEVTNLFYLSAIFVINHDLQLARSLLVGSALAEKALRFEVTSSFN